MAMPYDATMKDLLHYAADWLRQLHIDPRGPVAEIDADLSTVTALADKVLRIGAVPPWLLHLELQASRDSTLPRRLLKYNSLLHDHHELPVHSVVVLLRREALDPDLTGLLEYGPRPELGGLQFAYRVVPVWEWSVEELLAGGLGTLPLAPLSAEVTEERLPEVIRRMGERFRTIDEAQEVGRLWTATNVLLGLRFSRELAEQLLQGVQTMKESVTYQAIVEEGVQKGLERGLKQGRHEALVLVLLHLGSKRFGLPDAAARTALDAITDMERLLRMSDHLQGVGGWSELLAVE